jgi:hypothetical protein
MNTETKAIRIRGADDHALLRQGIASLIDIEPDMELVVQAATGREAIEQFRRHQPDITRGSADAGYERHGGDHRHPRLPLAHTLRLELAEWRSMCYLHVKGRNRFKQRSFYGEAISAYDLNYRWPRLCPACLRQSPIWWAVRDLGLVAACPRHGCVLLKRCPACQRKTGCERPAVYKCRCGFDLREVSPEPADPDMLAVTAIIYRSAGSTLPAAAQYR